MKITQIMLAKGFGGAERYFVDLSIALAEQDHEVQAICHRRFHGLTALRQHPAVHVTDVNVLGWWDWLAWRRIGAEVGRFGPALMHAHLARAAYIGGKVRRRTGIPLAVKTHNYVDLKYYRDVDLFLPTTADQRRYLVEHGIAARRIQVVPNFSSLSAVAEAGKIDTGPLVFGSFGRMVAKKGFDQLIDAFKQVLDAGIDARLVIGGDGVEREALVRRIAGHGCADRIELCGWVSDAAAFLDGIDVFVLPSLDEPFGIVVLEAMARGKVIVSTRTQGPSEVLTDADAYLAAAGNVDDLARAMREVAARPDEAVHKAARALEKFKHAYAKDVVVPQLLAHYAALQ